LTARLIRSVRCRWGTPPSSQTAFWNPSLRLSKLSEKQIVTDSQFEHLALINGEAIPVGVAIAAELVREGADWAYCSELWGSLVLVDHAGWCVPVEGPVAEVLGQLRDANDGSLSGLPDVIGLRGETVILREAKRRDHDKVQPQQHKFARAAQRLLGPNLDLAVVEWDLPATDNDP
jgi:hypothetical protein